ncbi:M1 family aminopeptidase [Vulcanisaeta sp. JCM 14467]|uniref:M1 family aminopeptidase n=1 Tax=Vulcanisaeta sp. JCM 14467 TaxID=1295370 RepID=UPI0031839E3D
MSRYGDFTSDGLVAHELAHQWFGDYVTTKDWANIWLNEAFATYFEALYTEHAKGRDEFLYELYQNLRSYLNEYGNRYARPIVIRLYRIPRRCLIGTRMRRVAWSSTRSVTYSVMKYSGGALTYT